jgi:ABC-2 type transport system permease protein
MTITIPTSADMKYNLWHYVIKLLRLRITITISGFRRAKLRRKIGTIILALFLLAIFILVFIGSWKLLGVIRSPAFTQSISGIGSLLDSIPILILAGAFLGILLTSFGLLLQALYLAGDMDFLLSAPVPIRAVFITKLLQAILPNFSLIVLLGLPILYGIGAAGRYHLIYYPLVLIILTCLALAAAGLSSLLVMGVVRIFPARRVAEVLAFLGAVLSILCSQSGQLTNSFDFSKVSDQQLTQGLGFVSRLNTPWSPLNWAGRGLVDIGEGRWLTGIAFIIITILMTSAVFVVSLQTAERLYYTGWASVQVGTRRKKPPRAIHSTHEKQPSVLSPIRRFIPLIISGIIFKDFLVIRRDLRSMSQVVTPLIFGIIYAIMLLRTGGEPPAGRGEAPTWIMASLRAVLTYGNVAISLFVGWSLLSRLAMMGFSQEGKNYWLLKSAPVGTGQLLTAKFLVAYLPSLALGWVFLIVISLVQRASLSVFIYGFPVVAFCIAGTAGINLAFGVAGVNLEWEDPRHMSMGITGCLGALLSFLYMLISFGLFFIPPIGFITLNLPEVVGQLIGLSLGGVVGLVCAILPLWLVRNRVPRIGEA